MARRILVVEDEAQFAKWSASIQRFCVSFQPVSGKIIGDAVPNQLNEHGGI